MKKFKVLGRISFIDVDKTAISEEAMNLLESYLLGYTDASPSLQENLYYLEDAIGMLNDSNVPATAEGMGEIVLLQQLCIKKKAAYIRFVVSPPALPGQQHTRYYTPTECAEIGRIAVVLSDHYCLVLCKAAQQGYIGAVDILYSWAHEFFESYGFIENDAQEWDEIIIQWGGQRLERFRTEGA